MFNGNKMMFKDPYPYIAIYKTNKKLHVIFLCHNYCIVIKTDKKYEADWNISTLHPISEDIFDKQEIL